MSHKIAIIGGGGAGMICAYLLNKAGHKVSVFEKQNFLGGNIRTSNKNMPVEGLDKNVLLEGGVIEFPEAFKNFKRILDELGVKQKSVVTSSGLFTLDGKMKLAPEMIANNRNGINKIRAYFDFFTVQLNSVFLLRKARKLNETELYNKSLKEVLTKNNLGSTWFKNLTMYSYSIPYVSIDDFPAEMAVPALRDYMMGDWFRIEEGVYSYIEKILEKFQGSIFCDTEISSIQRTSSGILLKRDGEVDHFDKVVFALPPDKVLQLLEDATPSEIRRFELWKANKVESIIHCDLSFYEKYDISQPSEFDFFETEDGWGYNAYLNNLCGNKGNTPYSLSYNLNRLIDPKKIIQIVNHETPYYHVDSFGFRNEIISHNGENNTYFAGAYLGDGLHEGAALSAIKVAGLIEQEK